MVVPFGGHKSKSGWAALCREPWHVAAIYGTRKQAEAKARELGEGYKVFYGEQRVGSDEFTIRVRPPRRRSRVRQGLTVT